MRNLLRRVRGALGMGLTWAVAWSFVGGIPRWLFGVNTDAPLPILFGILGFICGVTFSVVVLLTERRRKFDEMSIARFAGWGAVGGVALSALFVRNAVGIGEALAIPPALALACAACASGTLALARRATMPALPDGMDDDAELEFAAEEREKLPSRVD